MQGFQIRVNRWLVNCFGREVAYSVPDRCWRFLEEAIELVHSLGCAEEEAHDLVSYVFGRGKGESSEEVGDVVLTLAALCSVTETDMTAVAWDKLCEVEQPGVMDRIRAKQASKAHGTSLPGGAS